MASVAKREWTYRGEKRSAWVVRYKDVGGEHRSKQFDLKKDADNHRRLVERELEDGSHTADRATKTVAEVAAEYMIVQDGRVRQGEILRGRYGNIAKAVYVSIIPYLGPQKVRDVSAAKVEAWFRDLIKMDGLAPATAKSRYDELRQLFRFAVRRGYLKIDGAAQAHIGRVARVKVKTFTLEQVQAILDQVEVRQPRFRQRSVDKLRLIVHLAVFCGLRSGEIRALRVRNIDLDRNLIRVRESLSDTDGLKGPKTEAGVRDVPVPAHLADMLEVAALNKAPGDPVFATIHGKLLPKATLQQEMWYPLLKRAGLWNDEPAPNGRKSQYHFHALRHFASSMWLADNMPLPDAAALLGHSNFDVTLKVYAHAMVGGNRQGQAIQSTANRVLLPAPIAQE